MLIHIDIAKTMFYIDAIKGLHTNCRLARCFVSYADEHLSDYHGIAWHYDDVIMGAIASQITSLTIVYSTVYSGADQSKHQSSASLALVRGIHRGPVNSPHKWPVTRKMFPFDDVIMTYGFCVAGPACGESTTHWRIPLQTINSAELCCLISDFCIASGALILD